MKSTIKNIPIYAFPIRIKKPRRQHNKPINFKEFSFDSTVIRINEIIPDGNCKLLTPKI